MSSVLPATTVKPCPEAFQTGLWYHEKLETGVVYSYGVNQLLHAGNSEFQKVEVLDTIPFGRTLITDGLLQSTYADEFVYHECLVHPALVLHGNPKRVYIGGGGEGASLREVLRHKSVEECVMVDIDGVVVDMCKQHMPNHSAGTFDDARTKLIVSDAKAELEKFADGYFDAIVLDLSDPLDGGPCYQLYTVEFYTMCFQKLSDKGTLVTQCGCASVRDVQSEGDVGVFSAVHNTLRQVFPKVFGYTVYIPSFCSEWGYNVATKDSNCGDLIKSADIDSKINSMGLVGLKYYDQGSHSRLFNLCKPVRNVVEQEKRVMTRDNPLFMTHATAGILSAPVS